MQAWGTDLGELRRVFEEERNAWMDREEAEWLGLVQPYQNVVSTLQYTEVMGFIAICCCTLAYTRSATDMSAGRACCVVLAPDGRAAMA